MDKLRFYILIFFFLLVVKNSQAQQDILTQSFSFKFNNISAEAALETISGVTGFSFAYNPLLLNNIKPITASYSNLPLREVLQDMFRGHELNFKEVCNYIAITKKAQGDEIPDVFTQYTDSSGYYFLKAKVIDKSDNKPVPFANILIKGRNLGTVTNLDGNFSLKIPSGCSNDSIVISFIGYKSVTLNISAISVEEIISIQPVSIELNEVVVKHYEPVSLIKLANEKVADNYNNQSELQVGFYRETSKQNNDYIVISEAVLKILKAAYARSYKTDQVIVYKSRKSPFVKSMDTVLYKLQGGIYNSLMIDVAKHPASFISDDYFNMYNYKFEGLTQFNNQPVYVISFDQKPEVHYPLYKGKIYIDQESHAFVKADFGISPIGLVYATSILVKKSSSKIKAKVLDANYMVSYSFQNDIWKLHHVREEIKIRVRKKFSFFNSTFHSVSELVITDSDTASIGKFRNADLVRPTHIFSEVQDSYDESFWGKFNFIQPEVTLEEAYGIIKSALKKDDNE